MVQRSSGWETTEYLLTTTEDQMLCMFLQLAIGGTPTSEMDTEAVDELRGTTKKVRGKSMKALKREINSEARRALVRAGATLKRPAEQQRKRIIIKGHAYRVVEEWRDADVALTPPHAVSQFTQLDVIEESSASTPAEFALRIYDNGALIWYRLIRRSATLSRCEKLCILDRGDVEWNQSVK